MRKTHEYLQDLRYSVRNGWCDEAVVNADKTDNTKLIHLAGRMKETLDNLEALKSEMYDEGVRAEIRLQDTKRPTSEDVESFVDQILSKAGKRDGVRDNWAYLLPDGTLEAWKWFSMTSFGKPTPTRRAVPEHALFYVHVTNASREDAIRAITNEINKYWN